MKFLSAILCIALLCSCSTGRNSAEQEPSSSVSSSKEQNSSFSSGIPDDDADTSAPEVDIETNENIHPYISELAKSIADKISTPDLSEYERAKAAFDYMIQHTVLGEPIGLDLWRIHGDAQTAIPYLEQRALSPLRFGVGMCEDYAAALTILLREMGLSAIYVPGLTYSAEGELVDHAWTMVQIDGDWYHLDCQLEDNISRHGTVRYRYFLKDDAIMAGSHRWGQNLISSGLLTSSQNAEIAQNYLAPTCPQDYPTPERLAFDDLSPSDLSKLREAATAEISAFENVNGPLPSLTLNTTPPVFGAEGFGPVD